jgi:hypothetical protein
MPNAHSHAPAAFADTFRREHATTVRVLRAFPAERADFRPHERSGRALDLARTFAGEARMSLAAARGEPVLGSGMPAADVSWDDAVDEFAALGEEIASVVLARGDELASEKVQFYTGPRQMGEYPAMAFLWFLLHDQIHHRGQLSVYLRMAGGRVPSIYGPTADEPWH